MSVFLDLPSPEHTASFASALASFRDSSLEKLGINLSGPNQAHYDILPLLRSLKSLRIRAPFRYPGDDEEEAVVARLAPLREFELPWIESVQQLIQVLDALSMSPLLDSKSWNLRLTPYHPALLRFHSQVPAPHDSRLWLRYSSSPSASTRFSFPFSAITVPHLYWHASCGCGQVCHCLASFQDTPILSFVRSNFCSMQQLIWVTSRVRKTLRRSTVSEGFVSFLIYAISSSKSVATRLISKQDLKRYRKVTCGCISVGMQRNWMSNVNELAAVRFSLTSPDNRITNLISCSFRH